MFQELVKNGFKVQGRKKEYVWLPLTLRKYGEFVKWVQYLPYHEAKENKLPKALQDEILAECRRGIVIEKVMPDDWPDEKDDKGNLLKELKDEDLVDKEYNIHLGSTAVSEQFFTARGLNKLLELGISISYPEINDIALDQAIDTLNQAEGIKEIQDAMMGEQRTLEKNE